jgi:hypothetical protein
MRETPKACSARCARPIGRTVTTMIVALAAIFGGAQSAQAAVDLAWLFKYENYEQTSHAAPTTPTSFEFYTYVLAAPGDFTAPGTLTGPAGTYSTSFFAGDDFVTTEHYADAFSSRSALDAAAPDGSYTFGLNGGLLDGQSGSIPLVNPWPEQIPTLTPASFDALQAASPGKSVTIDWNTFVPAAIAQDARVRLFLVDETDFNFLIEESAMTPGTTGYTIPGDLLLAGHAYALFVLFSNMTETSGPAFETASVLSDVYIQTAVHFTVVPIPAALPLLASASLLLPLLRRRCT